MVSLSDFSIERLPDYSDDELTAFRDKFLRRAINAGEVAKFHDEMALAQEGMGQYSQVGIAELRERRDMANEIRAHAMRMEMACQVEQSIRFNALGETH